MLDPGHGTPEPPEAQPVKGSSGVRLFLTIIFAIVLTAGAFLAPIPIFFAYLPGPVRDMEQLVEVEDARVYSSEGSLLLTTVSVDPDVTFVDMLRSQFDDTTAIVFEEDVTGGQPLEDLIEQQKQEMEASKKAAQEVALAALGFGRPTGDGARVQGTLEGQPARGVLEEGDVILEVDGMPVETTCDVGRAINAHEVGEDIELLVSRAGDRESFELRTAENPSQRGSAFIGVWMEDVNYRFEPGVEVEFKTGKIGGPSGGLMMTLALYDQLTPDDLTAGRKVAGTGTIECDGGVGAIGGIEQKVAGAAREGAEIFLTPAGNVAAARKVADGIEIVEVADFDDAVRYLEALE